MNNKTVETVERLERLIKARTPVIAIGSPEEARVCSFIQQVARTQGKQVVEWSASVGFQQTVPEPAQGQIDLSKLNPQKFTPTKALLKVAYEPSDQPTIYVFKDLTPYVAKNDRVRRSLRDVFAQVRSRPGDTLIILDAAPSIPDDIKKNVTMVDFPLPSKAELETAVETFAANLDSSRFSVNLNGQKPELVRALQGLTAVEADNVLAQCVAQYRTLDERAIDFVLEAKAQIIKDSGALEFYPQRADYGEIGGLDLLKDWAKQAKAAQSPEARKFGIEPPRGVLLVGVSGCGKSLTAKAIAGDTMPLLRLDMGALFGGRVGESEENTRRALKVANAVSPCVLWMDEVEKGLGSGGAERDGGTSQRVLGTILTWMEEKAEDVFIVATANDADALRAELVQRFSAVFFIDLPDASTRRDIIEIHIAKKGRNPKDFDVSAVVDTTENFSGREIRDLVNESLMRAFQQGHELDTSDFLTVATQTVTSAVTMKDQIARMRSWASRARPASSTQETGHQQQPQNLANMIE